MIMGNREDPEKNTRPGQDESKMLGLVLNMLTEKVVAYSNRKQNY